MADEAKDSPMKDAQPYPHLADLAAHRQERDVLIAQHLAAMDGPPAAMEELRAHQALIEQREAELADMPVPPGIILSSSDAHTWMFVNGKWERQLMRISFTTKVPKSHSILVEGKTWTVRGPGDNQLETGSKLATLIAGVIIGVDSIGNICRGKIDGTRIEWSIAVATGVLYPVFCDDSRCIYVGSNRGIIAYDVEADASIVIPHRMEDVYGITADGDVLVLRSNDCVHCVRKDGRGGYTVVPQAPGDIIETMYLCSSTASPKKANPTPAPAISI